MPYQNNIPKSTDQLSQSQSDILNNFATLDTWVNVDHGGLNAAAGLQGTHFKVSMPVQGAAPVFPTPGTTTGFFTINSGALITNKSETYVHKQRQGVANGVDIPMTASILSNNAGPGSIAGWTYLPSGILLKWGTASGITAAGGNINVNTGGDLGPNFNAILNVQCTPANLIGATVFVTWAGPNINIRSSVTQNIAFFIVGY